ASVAWKSSMTFAITGFGVEYATRLRVAPRPRVLAARAAAGARPRAASPRPATPLFKIVARSYPSLTAPSSPRTLSTDLVGIVDLYMSGADRSNKKMLCRSRREFSLSPGYTERLVRCRIRASPYRGLGLVHPGPLRDHAAAERRSPERARADAQRLRGSRP